MAHPNEDLLRRGYEAFAQGDMATLDELFADDITWHSAGDTPMSGDHEGKEEVFGLFGTIQEVNDSFEQEIHDLLANDDHGVALVKTRAERNGEQLESNAVHVFHFADGKVSSFWNHSYDQAAVDEFYAD